MIGLFSLEEARALYEETDSAHDFDHVLRVTRMAERLARAEGADEDVVRAAALLHDIARHAEDVIAGQGTPAPDHAETAAEDARAYLIGRGADERFAERVAEAIRAHRFRGSVQPASLEAQILFDADKLDSIGAIGVARAYAVTGRLNQKLFTEPDPASVATRDDRRPDRSPVDEFHVKLKQLRGRLSTETARQIAEGRHAYMVEFFEELRREVYGQA